MLGYRMHFRTTHAAHDLTALAMEQMHAWLREKSYAADALATGKSVALADRVTGTLLERKEVDGSIATRIRIVEDTYRGRWMSDLTVSIPGSHGRDPSVWLEIDAPGAGEDIQSSTQWTGTPRLARRLLGVIPAYDGSARLSDRPISVLGSDAESLVDIICDPVRRGLVFVAGSDEGMPLQPWIDLVDQLLRDTIGLAAAYVLDSKATETLAQALGESHAVRPGTVRTFLPGADPASDLDALRHRVLTAERIVRGDGARVARLLGWKARETTLENPLPSAAMRLSRAFEHQLDALLTDQLIIAEPSAAPTSATLEDLAASAQATHTATVAKPTEIAEQASRYLALRELMVATLGIEEISPASLAEVARLAQLGRQAGITQAAVSDRLNDLQDRLSMTEASRQELARRLEDEQLEHAQTAQLGQEADRAARYLRGLLVTSGQAGEAWGPVPDEPGPSRPDSFDDLLTALPELPGIKFTGDPNITAILDDHDPIGTWAGKAWDALIALSDYARASSEGLCDRDVDGYLRNTPQGYRTFPANRHARDESEDVQHNRRFRAARLLPVPIEVDASGQAFMGAHFKIAQSGIISPRLHYLDDTVRSSQVYVGYIGPHLPTKRTN